LPDLSGSSLENWESIRSLACSYNMRIPTIHLNGTSKDAIASAIEEAVAALRAAAEKLGETAPNGRDYYPQGPEAIGEAVREHASRMQRLATVQTELMEIWESLTDGGC
jgi:acyl-CoA reductase-like NAD-dependent aldehyde dehydrogenase